MAALPQPVLPRIINLLFARDRTGFTLPVETYGHWVLLGSQKGSFRYAFGQGKEALCEPGEFLLCPPRVPLRRKALEKIDFCFVRFEWKPESPASWQGRHGLLDMARMESTMAYLEQLNNRPAGGDESIWANHLLADLLHQRQHERTMTVPPGKIPDRLMIQVAEKLRREIRQPSSLEEQARAIRLTASQLSRRFKAAFGANPSVYRTRLRIQEARRLLLETHLSVEEIAEACGFENAFYFSRVFTGQAGQPPSRFRKSHRV